MYIEFSNCRGVQKFVDTNVGRRNSIGCNLMSANSVPLFILRILGGEFVSTLKAYGDEIVSIFQLIILPSDMVEMYVSRPVMAVTGIVLLCRF